MSEEYLWDRSGEPDPEVERLEGVLGGLRFSPRELVVLPRVADAGAQAWARRRPGWGSVLKIAVLSAAATMAFLASWRCMHRGDAGRLEGPDAPAVIGPAPDGDDGKALAWAEAPGASSERAGDGAELDAVEPEPTEPERAEPEPTKPELVEPKDAPAQGDLGRSGAAPAAEPPELKRVKLRDPFTREPVDLADALPPKPDVEDIKQAIGAVKAEAQACGPRHEAAPGTTVRVKLSVAGATGRVIEVSITDEHRDTSLGRCVATVLAEARFPRFSTQRFGLQYSLHLK